MYKLLCTFAYYLSLLTTNVQKSTGSKASLFRSKLLTSIQVKSEVAFDVFWNKCIG